MKQRFTFPGYKQCSCCKQMLEVSDFYPSKFTKDGRCYYCKECVKKRVLTFYHNPRHRRHCIEVVKAYQKRKAIERQLGA